MLAGTTDVLIEDLAFSAATTVSAASCTVYDSAGLAAGTVGAVGIGANGTTDVTLSVNWTAPAVSVPTPYQAVFTFSENGRVQRRTQRVDVEPVPAAGGYPTAQDLRDFLLASGLSIPAGMELFLPTTIVAARREFEQAVSRVMVAGAAETRTFDPPVGGDLLSIDDAASVSSIVYQPQGSTAETLVLATNYLLEPQNAALQGRPYTLVRLRSKRWWAPLSVSLVGSIVVTARWGYAVQLPEDVHVCMLTRAAGQLFQPARFASTGGVSSWTRAGRSVSYGSVVKEMLDAWELQWKQAVNHYRRVLF